LEPGQVLEECGQPVMNMYFPSTAVISLFAASSEGTLIEAAIVGSEGALGVPAAITGGLFPFRATVQIAGTAAQISVKAFASMFDRDRAMQRRVNAYVNLLIVQLAQSAICNNKHTVEQRLARWLLAIRARSGLVIFPMTHELLSNILGTTRPVVTVAARTLKNANSLRIAEEQYKS